MKNDKILSLAMDAGQQMLINGAETYRVEDTMIRILRNYNFISIDAFVTTTGVFCTIVDQENNVHTMVRRIRKRTINLEKIAIINEISRSLTDGRINTNEAIERIEMVNHIPPYKVFYKVIASGVCCSCFSYMFGGNLNDFFSAFLAGIFLHLFVEMAGRKNISGFIINILGGALVSFVILFLTALGVQNNIDEAIIGSIMPLVPGVGLTNAVRDVMGGDYLSGSSRIIDAVMVAICIATGVGISLGAWFYFTGI